jgi:adenine-specific DNA-methyltransferase
MKYMGSKRWMLENGLGHLLRDEVPKAGRFIDLFTGSSAVASFVAQKTDRAVHAYDLQEFCASLAGSVVSRTEPLNSELIWTDWLERTIELLHKNGRYEKAAKPFVELKNFTRKVVAEAREACSGEMNLVITHAYGGHYFSHSQTLWIDALRQSLPIDANEKRVSLAALIRAASQCVAAPGHTAQPFQPTRTAKRFLHEGWKRDICAKVQTTLREICGEFATVEGTASVADANTAVESVMEKDLVFIDPPYSGVHYSRFYHVLETIARGQCGEISGIGRYPPPEERPRSKYSLATESGDAISDLLKKVAQRGATAIVTFPYKKCSNGISGKWLEKIAAEHFQKVERKVVRGRFSTLGGDGQHREARQPSFELVLVLRP